MVRRPSLASLYAPGSQDDPPYDYEVRELYFAILAGDLDRTRRALESAADHINSQFGDGDEGTQLLSLAAQHGHMDVFRFLLANKADPFALSAGNHRQPLHDAAQAGNVEVVGILLDLGADVNAACRNNRRQSRLDIATPLWLAIHHHQAEEAAASESRSLATGRWVETIDLLLARGAEFPPRPGRLDGPIPLSIPVHPPVPDDKEALLRMIINTGSMTFLKSYLAKTKSALGPKALVTAIRDGDDDLFQYLMHDLGPRDEGWRALKATGWVFQYDMDINSIERRVRMARQLLDSRRGYDKQDVHLLETLCAFSRDGNLELMALVLEHGVDVNAMGLDGLTPFLAACGAWRLTSRFALAAMKLLLDHGADIHSRVQPVDGQDSAGIDAYVAGSTCLHQWTRRGDLTVLKFLLDAGADVNAANAKGETPMMRLAMQGNSLEATKLLLEAGANPNAIDSSGRTVVHWLTRLMTETQLADDMLEEDRSMRDSMAQTLDLLRKHGIDTSIVDEDGNKAVDLLEVDGDLKSWLGPKFCAFFALDSEG